jgi:antirestriction protein ArdC
MARNVQAEIVDSIIESLEQGVAPWRKPWQSLGCQRNVADNRHYQGANAIWLSIMQEIKGYELPLWTTFEGAKKLGGHVKKGQKGVPVYWICPKERKKLDKDGNVVIDEETGEPKVERKWITGYWIVFNVAQTTIDPAKYANKVPQPKADNERDADIETFIGAVGLKVRRRGACRRVDRRLPWRRVPA